MPRNERPIARVSVNCVILACTAFVVIDDSARGGYEILDSLVRSEVSYQAFHFNAQDSDIRSASSISGWDQSFELEFNEADYFFGEVTTHTTSISPNKVTSNATVHAKAVTRDFAGNVFAGALTQFDFQTTQTYQLKVADATVKNQFGTVLPSGTFLAPGPYKFKADVGVYLNAYHEGSSNAELTQSMSASMTLNPAYSSNEGAPGGPIERTIVMFDGPATAYGSSIVVGGASGGIPFIPASLEVHLSDFNHAAPDDLDILLVSPAGKKVLLMSDAGGGHALTNANVSFKDGSSFLPDDEQIVSGFYRPGDFAPDDAFPAPAPGGPYGASLNSLLDDALHGAWKLYIFDDSPGNIGFLYGGWHLVFNPPSTSQGTAHFAAGFDGDADVDASDLSIWHAGFGAGDSQSEGDADGDLDVDGTDFLVWQRQLGSGIEEMFVTVPEPGGLVLLMLAVGLGCRRWAAHPSC